MNGTLTVTTIEDELDLLVREDKLNAEDVYEYAKKHPESCLHDRFEWDKDKAAHEYNLNLAMKIIQEYRWRYTTTENEVVQTRKWVSLNDDRIDGGGYRDIQDVLSSKVMRRKLLQEAIQSLEMWRTRFIVLEKELKPVFDAMKKL